MNELWHLENITVAYNSYFKNSRFFVFTKLRINIKFSQPWKPSIVDISIKYLTEQFNIYINHNICS